MPFGRYDQEKVFRYFVKEKLNCAVVLLGDNELTRRCGKDLKRLYARQGISMVQIPIEDFMEPGRDELSVYIPNLVVRLREGARMVVHCHAGVGRTAVVMACLLAALHDEDADHVLAYMRHYMEINLTPDQHAFVYNWISAFREGTSGVKPKVLFPHR